MGHPPRPHAGDGPSRPHAGEGPSRPRAVTQRLRWTSTSRRSFHKCPTSGPSRPHAGECPSLPRATCRHRTRLGWTPKSWRSFHKCPTSGPSRPHAGEGLSRPRVSWCSPGLAGSSAHSDEASRWTCRKGTPMVQTLGLS